MNFSLLVIQWMLLFILAIAFLITKRRLEIVRHEYRRVLKEAEAGKQMAMDVVAAKEEAERANTEKENYKRYSLSSDAARKAVLERSGIIPCAECKYLVELKNGSQPYYVCANHAGKAHIGNPKSCYCSEARRGNNEG